LSHRLNPPQIQLPQDHKRMKKEKKSKVVPKK